MQEFLPRRGVETSWRAYLFPLGRNPKVYDCPVEKIEVYANGPGFNRATQKDPGAFRHNRRSIYGFADEHVALLDPSRIPCDTSSCWWTAKADPH